MKLLSKPYGKLTVTDDGSSSKIFGRTYSIFSKSSITVKLKFSSPGSNMGSIFTEMAYSFNILYEIMLIEDVSPNKE